MLPQTTIPVVDTVTYAQNSPAAPPTLGEVLSTLSQHGIQAHGQSMEVRTILNRSVSIAYSR